MYMLRSTCFQAPCHVYAQIYMLLGSLPFLRLDLHAYMFFMFMLISTCLCILFHVCASIHMLLGSLTCLRLDVHAYVFLSIFMLRSTCFCVLCLVYAQIYIFECYMPCSCIQIYMLVAMPCASKALLPLDISLSCVLALIGGVQILILWSRLTSIHLGLY